MVDIVCRVTLEVLGSPKEHVEEAMKNVLKKISEDNEIKIIDNKVFAPQLMENKKLWNTFSEVEFKVSTLKKVLQVCYDYMPSNIVILEPAGMDMDCDDIADVFNDFLAQLHKYSTVLQRLNSENIVMYKELEKVRGNKVFNLNSTQVKKEKD
jgi:hypothetical protein